MITHEKHTPQFVNHASVRYHENRRYVVGVLGRRCRWLEPCQLEDIFHDSYLVLLEKFASGGLDPADMSAAQVRAYLTQTAIFKALDQGKQAARRHAVSLDREDLAEVPSAEPPIEEQVIVRDDSRRLQEAVTLLPERRRRVIELRYYLGCDPRQIQEHLGVTRDIYRHELERGTRAVAQAVAA